MNPVIKWAHVTCKRCVQLNYRKKRAWIIVSLALFPCVSLYQLAFHDDDDGESKLSNLRESHHLSSPPILSFSWMRL